MEQRLRLIKAITNLIFVEDKLQKADIIIVPGSSQPYFPQKASELYLKGYSKIIIFTGHFNPKINSTECDYGKNIALKAGIPKTDIFCESKSTNSKENAIEARILIRKFNLKSKRIILVSKPYHSRRLQMTFKKVFPDSKLIIIPVEDNRKINRKSWWKDREKINKVMEEAGKISEYYIKGDLTF